MIHHLKKLSLYGMALVCLGTGAVSCDGKDNEDLAAQLADGSITDIVNPSEGQQILGNATVKVSFNAANTWSAELRASDGETPAWAKINHVSGHTTGGKSTVDVNLAAHQDVSERITELWVTVKGAKAVKVATFIQGKGNSGVSNVNNPEEGKVFSSGERTITVTFTADGPWEAELLGQDEQPIDWARISRKVGQDEAGDGQVRIMVEKNTLDEERTAYLWISVEGYERMSIASFTQSKSGSDKEQMSAYLNKEMDAILREHYLWRDAYSAIDVDMNLSYEDFLFTNLLKPGLAEVNGEDGGIYRAYHSKYGERYIYSNIQDVSNYATRSDKAERHIGALPSTRARSRQQGTGVGQMFFFRNDTYSPGNGIIMLVGYVYPGSPADKAGIKRGDGIYKVNGYVLTTQNYMNYANAIFASPTGSYNLGIGRNNDKGAMIETVATVSADVYEYSAILTAGIMSIKDRKIGYLVSESFDYGSQEDLDFYLQEFKKAGINELILDLRYNVGGLVAQSRYLTSAIAGRQADNKTFTKMRMVDGSELTWDFGKGMLPEGDGLGQAPDLGLNRVFVITSENTASASEMLINALRGIDFDIKTYGSRSEGKNVGMDVTMLSYGARHFEFAPITFWTRNAKDFSDFATGMDPDYMTNNQDNNYQDDIDQVFPYSFADWGNSNYDATFYWALSNVLGEEPDFGSKTRSLQQNIIRVGAPMELPHRAGRYGSLIYRK